MTSTSTTLGVETLLDGFEPDFEFVPVPRISEAEYASRIERLRRAATVAGHDALLVHADGAARYAQSNNHLRYACNWEREGILIIPTDTDRGLQLLSFFTQAAIMPPAGDAVGVEAIWQVGAVGREFSGRPGDSGANAAIACANLLTDIGYGSGSIGVVGDSSSLFYWNLIRELLPKARLQPENGIFDRLQRQRSTEELSQIRAAAQLIDIGYQAACYVTRTGVTDYQIYAAFTFAQLARGGETGDGYQIGVNPWGTHCGKPYGHVVRPGDLINLYISNVIYHGYACQSARMIAVGDITDVQEETLAMCTEAVQRAERLIRPGAQFRELHDAAFSSYTERDRLPNVTTATMPYSWAPADDDGPRLIPGQYVRDEDLERQGQRLTHVYPALAGPHNPNLGHETGTYKGTTFNIASHNTDVMLPGMVFVLHAQWLDPMTSGANIGDAYTVTANGYERLTSHSPLETFRIPA